METNLERERSLYRIRLLGFLSAAVLVGIALMGASTASATSLCSEKPEEAKEQLICPKGTTLSSALFGGESESVAELEFKEGEFEDGNINCGEVTFGSEVASMSEKVEGEMTSFEFENCESQIPNCTYVSNNPITPMTMVLIAQRAAPPPEGIVRVFKPRTDVVLNCQGVGVISCTYGNNPGESMTGNYYNAAQQVKVDARLVKSAGPAACFQEFWLRATFNVFREVGGTQLQLYLAIP